MTYDYTCSSGHREERTVFLADRDCQSCQCGRPLRRLPHFHTVTIGIPQALHTSMTDVIGLPGSIGREQFDQQLKSGEVQYAGKGSRWI